jgi:GTPase SAR1 family protein
MAIPVLIIGKSGSGKTTSLRNFKHNEMALINVIGKQLPFRGTFDEQANTDSYKSIMAGIAKSHARSIVIDDAGYLITNQFMRNHSTGGSGNAIFSLYNEIADNFWNLIEFIKHQADDKIVYVIMHEDKNDFGEVKPKTIGKLLDEKVSIEGMFTIVLRSIKDNGKYVFKTKTDGLDVTKTPIDMFADEEIDNDLKAVDSTIRNYYDIKNVKQEENNNEKAK